MIASNDTLTFNVCTSFAKFTVLLKGKVKCTLVQALRLCTGRTAGKVHPCTGTEAVYRPYGL